MEAYEQYQDDVPVVLTLSGELDAADPGWADELQEALRAGQRQVVVDLRNVTFIDSSVIRALVLAGKKVPQDGWLRLVYTHHLIRRVIDICGLSEAFPQFTTLDAAVRNAPSRSAVAHDGAARSSAGSDVPGGGGRSRD